MTFQVNTQPIEKRERHYDGTLSVHSIFYTIQGEGPFCGTPAVFVRLAGCNLQCPGCDTEYTVGRKPMTPNEILFEVNALMRAERWRRGLVVISGGEPFRQYLAELLGVLEGASYYVQIESNGTLPPPNWAWSLKPDERAGSYIVVSPKTGRINPAALQAACCLKYVIEAGDYQIDDGLPNHALRHSNNGGLARPPAWWDRPIYIQPMDSKDDAANEASMKAALASAMKHGYILQLQIHKLIGVE